MRELKTFEIASVKRQFLNSLPTLKKIQSLDEKIAKLNEERAMLCQFLEGGEAGIKAMTGGYMSTDLIKCEYLPIFNEDGTPKMDEKGKYQQKKRVLTFVPPVEDEVIEVPASIGNPGSDYDLDKEVIESKSTESFGSFSQI